EVAADRPGEEGFAADEGASPALAVAAPELLPPSDPPHGPEPKPPQDDPERLVEPDGRVRALEHVVPELALVVAVHDPASADGRRFHRALKVIVARLRPVRAVVQGVELDVREAESLGEGARHRRLPVPARADDRDPGSHARDVTL